MVPYHRCARWRAHEEYFAQRGLAPWLEGEVPHQATNNYAFARAHATLLCRLTRCLARDGRLAQHEALSVLEVGSGPGWFAGHFLRALRDDLGAEGRRLLSRLRYLFSDASPSVLTEAAAREDLAAFVEAGVLVPLFLDAAAPGSARTREGAPVQLQPLLVIANYVCCVLPPRLLRRTPEGWKELYAAATKKAAASDPSVHGASGWGAVLGEHEWRDVSLEKVLPDVAHRRALEKTLGSRLGAELAYPQTFLDFTDSLRTRLLSGGAIVFSDFADESYEDGIELCDRTPLTYGASLAQPVCFPAIRAFAAERGLQLLESRPGHGATRTVLLSGARVPRAVRALFEASFADANAGQDLLDFAAAAKALGRAGHHQDALRFYDRALRLAPRDPLLYLRAGEEALAAGTHPAALAYFQAGARADTGGCYDFDCRIGEVYSWTPEPRRAIPYLEASLRRDEKAGKYVLLGDARSRLGEHERAYQAYRRALDMEPGQPAALEGLQLLNAVCPGDVLPVHVLAETSSCCEEIPASRPSRPARAAAGRSRPQRLTALRPARRSWGDPGRSG